MIGAIIGDIAGSIYEFNNIKTTDFPIISDDCFFTDDTVMTFAVAEALIAGNRDEAKTEKAMVKSMKKYGKRGFSFCCQFGNCCLDSGGINGIAYAGNGKNHLIDAQKFAA